MLESYQVYHKIFFQKLSELSKLSKENLFYSKNILIQDVPTPTSGSAIQLLCNQIKSTSLTS